MHDAMPHASDSRPWDLRVRGTELDGQPPRRFADDSELPQNCILPHTLRCELLVIRAMHIGVDELNSLQYVGQRLPQIRNFHTA